MSNKKPGDDPLEFACIIADKLSNYGSLHGVGESVEEAIVEGCRILTRRIVETLENKDFDAFVAECVKEAIADVLWEKFGESKIEINIVTKEAADV